MRFFCRNHARKDLLFTREKFSCKITADRMKGEVKMALNTLSIPGGVLAVSFNTLTLPSCQVREALLRSGFRLPRNEKFAHLSHEVDHAVVRDVVFALNTEEESVV